MNVERALRLLAGAMVLLTVALTWLHDPRWLWLTAFVGVNLLQSAITNWCPAVWVLEKLGIPRCERNPPSGEKARA